MQDNPDNSNRSLIKLEKEAVDEATDLLAQVRNTDPGFYDTYIKDQWEALIINAVRDFTWALISYELYNDRLKHTEDDNYNFDSIQFGQLLMSVIAMLVPCLIAAVFFAVRIGCNDIQYSLKEKLTNFGDKIYPWLSATLAAALPIYSWDAGQQLGLKVFGEAGAGPMLAGCLTGIFTGLGEGWIQWLSTTTTGLVYTETRKTYRENPKATFFKLSGEFLWSVGPGSLPGAMWQVAWMMGKAFGFGAIGTSGLVSGTVCVSNFLYQISAKWLSKKLPDPASKKVDSENIGMHKVESQTLTG